MTTQALKDPFLRGYLALGILLLPVIVLLAEAYPGYEERMRRAAGAAPLQPIPAVEVLREQVAGLVPDTERCQWRQSFTPEEEPPTGVVRGYDLLSAGELRYRLLLVRHDIACGVCRDLLVALLYDAGNAQWAGILALEPFERKGASVDAAPFLHQFVGQPTTRQYILGADVDGITGATKSVKGFINRLHEAGAWLAAHQPQREISAGGITPEAQP